MSTSNEGGARPDTAMSNPSPITTTSAHDTSNRGGGGDMCEDMEGVVATPTEDVEVSVPERHNDFKDEKRVCRDTSMT